MRKSNILLIGKPYTTDYTGSKTTYIWNALAEAGINTCLLDITSSNDTPPGCTHAIYLDWIHLLDEDWANMIKHLPIPRKILYTDNWYWYDNCRNNFVHEQGFNVEQVFSTIAFGTTENMRWWPKVKFEYWGVCIDEDMAAPKKADDYIYVDEVWPEKWCSGEFSAKDVLDIAIPRAKKELGVDVVSQKTEAEWVDHQIEPTQELPEILNALGKAKAFIVTHEEALGLMQFEAQVCGVPVVTNPRFSKNEVFQAGEGCTYTWEWGKKQIESQEGEEGAQETQYEVDLDVEKAAEKMFKAIKQSLKSDRGHIRESAVNQFGKQAWLERVEF